MRMKSSSNNPLVSLVQTFLILTSFFSVKLVVYSFVQPSTISTQYNTLPHAFNKNNQTPNPFQRKTTHGDNPSIHIKNNNERSHAISSSITKRYGLFGLGIPEIAVIVIAGAFLLGPQKLADLGKDAGKIAGELKEVPKEFQKGFSEGETVSKARNAKPMDKIPSDDDDDE